MIRMASRWPNLINRFAIGDRDNLTFNQDGSLDIYVQAEPPGPEKETNWLPAPKDAPFGPTLRIYSPRYEVLNGTWTPQGSGASRTPQPVNRSGETMIHTPVEVKMALLSYEKQGPGIRRMEHSARVCRIGTQLSEAEIDYYCSSAQVAESDELIFKLTLSA
jgi:hypothetical protein